MTDPDGGPLGFTRAIASATAARSSVTDGIAAPAYAGTVVDCGVYHDLAEERELLQYLPSRWRSFIGPNRFLPAFPYRNPQGDDRLGSSPPTGGDPDSQDWSALTGELLTRERATRAVLLHRSALFAAGVPSHFLATELCQAANTWAVERCLSEEGDGRLLGSVLAPTQEPDRAAKEIERAARHPRMVTVVIGASGLGKPLGHPIYHPIYRAASEAGLPLTLHVGGDALVEATTTSAAVKAPMLYSEYRALAPQALMTHLVSLVAQGVFESFPDLRVLLFGAGVAWVPALLWRFDAQALALRTELPWLRRRPSEYVAERVKISTYPLDRPAEAERLATLVRAYPSLQRMLCFASGYPSWDSELPDEVAARLPGEWLPEVFRGNALDLYNGRLS